MKEIDNYIDLTKGFSTALDFLRFGISMASKKNLYYGHGTQNAYDDFYYLIFDVLGLPIIDSDIFLHATLTTDEKKLLAKKIYLRIEKLVPVPYLTNKSHLFGLEFFVDERVLIPRSPIAELIQNQFSPWIDATKVKNILEIGTGSACLAITACLAFPDALVDATDISSDALEVAAINRDKYQLGSQLELIESNCFEKIPVKKYDIIFSNPPYVSEDEIAGLPLEYKAEPILALEAPDEGLLIVSDILSKASKYLSEGGILVIEVGNTYEALIARYPQLPFTWLEFEHGGHGVFLLTKEQLV